MQTQPKPSQTEGQDSELEKASSQPAMVFFRVPLKKWLNVGIALAVTAVAGLYITKGWTIYEKLPGGRKVLFAVVLLVLAGLVGARLFVGYKQETLHQQVKTYVASLRVWHFLLVAIVGLALLVRVWSINFGMPYLEQPDEWNVADRALNIIQTGSFDPLDYRNPNLPDNDRQAFTYPSLYTYMQTGVFAAKFMQGVSAGKYDGTSGLGSVNVKPDFYLWGRALTALLGAGTVLLVFLVGARWFNRRVGLTAALFLAFFALHVTNSRFITTDVPSGFFALLPFLPIFWILQGSEKRRLYLLAGVLCGLAVGTKYNNGLILLPLVLAHLLGRPRQKWLGWNLPLAGLGAFVGFFVSSPFIFLHLPNFLTDLAAIVNHYQNTGHPGYEGSNNWLFYLQAMATDNLLVLVLALAGVALAFARHSKQETVLLSFPLVSYLQLSSYKVNFTRNLMPIVPFLCIFAGLVLVALADFATKRLPQNLNRWQGVALSLVGVLVIIGPATGIMQHASLNAAPTARASATEYIEKNIPAGSKLWIEPFSVELLPRSNYRLEGGSVLANPPEWYAANGFNYLVLSEAYHKESRETGKDSVKAAYNALIDGPRPAGITLEKDFQVNTTDAPGARIIILRTTLPTVAKDLSAFKIDRPLRANLGSDIRLAGAEFPDQIQSGKTINVVLYWQTLAPPQRNYSVFVHVLDSNNKIVAQVDLAPMGGSRPTSIWQTDEVIRDEYPIKLPDKLAPGTYRLVAGMYQPPNGPRLTLPDGADSVPLGPFTVK